MWHSNRKVYNIHRLVMLIFFSYLVSGNILATKTTAFLTCSTISCRVPTDMKLKTTQKHGQFYPKQIVIFQQYLKNCCNISKTSVHKHNVTRLLLSNQLNPSFKAMGFITKLKLPWFEWWIVIWTKNHMVAMVLCIWDKRYINPTLTLWR